MSNGLSNGLGRVPQQRRRGIGMSAMELETIRRLERMNLSFSPYVSLNSLQDRELQEDAWVSDFEGKGPD